jgi:hypothetical protein
MLQVRRYVEEEHGGERGIEIGRFATLRED